jgi:hypothetical protein
MLVITKNTTILPETGFAKKRSHKKRGSKTNRTRSKNRAHGGSRSRDGGGMGTFWKKIKDKVTSIMPKNKTDENVVYSIKRNPAGTADTLQIIKNGKVINEKEVPDDTMNSLFSNIIKSIKQLFTKNEKNTEEKKTGGFTNNENANTNVPYPHKVIIDENSHTHQIIYKRRNGLDIFARLIGHLLLLFFFTIFYIIFVLGYAAVNNGNVPLSFFKKYILINGKEVEV